MADNAAELKEAMTKPPPREAVKPADLLSTGSTLLNLALSGRTSGGLCKGKYIRYVGDSDSGKTWLTLTALAEATKNPYFEDYRFIFDNAEDGALMDVERFFGKELADKLEPPGGTREAPAYSTTVEEFYFHLKKATQQGPCIYVLDSMEGIRDEAEKAKFEKDMEAWEKDKTPKDDYDDDDDSSKKPKGSYAMTKAKKNAAGITECLPDLRATGSILIVIGQTRDNINAGQWGEKKKDVGGWALTFFAMASIWTSTKEKIFETKTLKGVEHKREVGILAKVRVKRSRLTGKDRTVEIPIKNTYGIDDIGSCIDFITFAKHWPKSSGKIEAKELGFEGKKADLIEYIEQNNKEKELRKVTGLVWRTIEEAFETERKPRY